MLKTKIIVINFIILAVLGTAVFAQVEDETAPVQQDNTLPKYAQVERETTSSLFYIVAGIVIGVVSTSGVSYIYYHRLNNGTEHDHEKLETPVNIHSHDKLANKHGDLQSPEIEKHGNQFM